MSFIWFYGYVYTAVGFGVGGIIAWLFKGLPQRIDTIYSICVGLILGLVCFEIAPEAIELGNWIIFIIGFFVGVLFYRLIHTSFIKIISPSNHYRYSLHMGLFLMLGITCHNLPIGIVLGSNQDTALKPSLLQAILLHNIPEGLIIFTPLFIAGLGIGTWVLLSILVAGPVGIGAYFGGALGIGNPSFWSFFISMTVGIIYMVTVKEILIEAIKTLSVFRVLVLVFLSFCFIGGYFHFI